MLRAECTTFYHCHYLSISCQKRDPFLPMLPIVECVLNLAILAYSKNQTSVAVDECLWHALTNVLLYINERCGYQFLKYWFLHKQIMLSIHVWLDICCWFSGSDIIARLFVVTLLQWLLIEVGKNYWSRHFLQPPRMEGYGEWPIFQGGFS